MVAKLAVCLLTYLILFNPNVIFASEKEFLTQEELKSLGFTQYEKINPNLQIYPLKKVVEILTRKNAFARYESRFNELVYIINNDKTGFLIETVHRYNTFSGILKSANTLDASSKAKIKKNLYILERLRDRYHSASGYWEKIQQTVDSTGGLI